MNPTSSKEQYDFLQKATTNALKNFGLNQEAASKLVKKHLDHYNKAERTYHNATREKSLGHLYQLSQDITIKGIKSDAGLVALLFHDIVYNGVDKERPDGYESLATNLPDDITFRDSTLKEGSMGYLVNVFFDSDYIKDKRDKNPNLGKNEYQSALYTAKLLEELGVNPRDIKEVVATIAATVPFLGEEYVQEINTKYYALSGFENDEFSHLKTDENNIFQEKNKGVIDDAIKGIILFSVKDVENFVSKDPLSYFSNSARVSIEMTPFDADLETYKNSLKASFSNTAFLDMVLSVHQSIDNGQKPKMQIIPKTSLFDVGGLTVEPNITYKNLAENGIKNSNLYMNSFLPRMERLIDEIVGRDEVKTSEDFRSHLAEATDELALEITNGLKPEATNVKIRGK